MRKRYRYISCGAATHTDKISKFRLIGGNQLIHKISVIRVEIPNDLKLTKYSCDNYSTTDDARTLDELGCDIMVRINGKFAIRNDLKRVQLGDIGEELRNEKLYIITPEGYMDMNHYREYLNKLDEKTTKRKQRARKLKDQLDSNPAYVDYLKNQDSDVLVEVIKMYVSEKHKREIW